MTHDTDDKNEEDELDEFFDAQDIYLALEAAGLVDDEARVSLEFDPENYVRQTQFLYTEGKKNDHSPFSGDDIDIDGYFLEVDIWAEEDTNTCALLVRDKYSADEAYLVGLAGPRWSIVLRRGAKDASIPKNISKQLLGAVDGSVLIWQRPIPAAQWFISKYSLASEIIHELQRKDSSVRVQDPLSADGVKDPGEYICDSILDDTFGTALLQIDWMVDVTLHVFIENHWAHQNADWLESYLPCSWKQVHVAGDGWVVRIVGDPGGIIEPWLVGVAQDVQAILGGSVFKDGNQVTS